MRNFKSVLAVLSAAIETLEAAEPGAGQRAADTRKKKQIPIEVTIHGAKIPAVMRVHNGKVVENMILFKNRNSLKKIAQLPMVSSFYYDDNGGNHPSKGQSVKLGSLLERNPSSLYMTRQDHHVEKAGWYLTCSIHSNDIWSSEGPVDLKIQKTTVPDEVDFGDTEASVQAATVKASLEPKVSNLIHVLVANLTQYDMKISAKEAERGTVNIYRLGHYLAAAEKVSADMESQLGSSDPEAMKALKESLGSHFEAGFVPVVKTIKAIDGVLAGKPLKYPISRE